MECNKNEYYTSMNNLLEVYDERARKLGFNANNIQEYEKWKLELRKKLTEITGLNRFQYCDLNPKVLESVKLDGYRRDKIVIQTEKNVWMPFYMLVPDNIKEGEKRKCIIAPHGHGSVGKEAIAGTIDNPEIIEKIGKYNYGYAINFVKRGYIVFCNDARGAGERREHMNQGTSKEALLSSSCNNLNFAAISLGQSLTGMLVFDLMRLIDYIEQCDNCDAEAIACAGFSGGGLQSLWLAALDDRIKCAVVSGYFHGYKDTILRTNLCGCNFVPHLWETADVCDLGALIAPRALLVESGNKDNLNGERGLVDVKEQVNITLKAYKLYQKEEKFYHYVFDGAHQWNGLKTYEFIDKWL